MKKLLSIILTTLVIMGLAVGCSNNEPETSASVSTLKATTSTPTAIEVTTQLPASTTTTTTTTSQTSITTPSVTTTTTTPPTTEPSTSSSFSEPEEVPVYFWEEATDHVREMATVIGPVITAGDVLHPGLTVHFTLVLGANDNRGVFVQIGRPLVESLPEDMYIGRTIAVTGNINELSWEGDFTGTRIWVDDLSQIEIIE